MYCCVLFYGVCFSACVRVCVFCVYVCVFCVVFCVCALCVSFLCVLLGVGGGGVFICFTFILYKHNCVGCLLSPRSFRRSWARVILSWRVNFVNSFERIHVPNSYTSDVILHGLSSVVINTKLASLRLQLARYLCLIN